MDASDHDIEKRWLILARLDPAQFTRFYEKYFDGIYRFCRRRVLDEATAEDLTSETFLRAQRNLHRFRWQGVTMGAWLYRIARNLVRRHATRSARLLHLPPESVSVVDPRLSPLAEVVLSERQRRVRAAVARLDAPSQEVFLLHYWEEMTTRQIAAVLGQPEGTVKTRLRRGRLRMQQELAALLREEDGREGRTADRVRPPAEEEGP